MPKMSKEEFLKKHPPLSDKEIKEKLKQAQKTKTKYSRDMKAIEKNLLGYMEEVVPIVHPETDKVLAWMRCPLNEELEEYYKFYADTIEDEDISLEQRIKDSHRQYQLMSDLITIPEHDAEWWRKNTNPLFSKLFANRLEIFFEQLGVTMENF